MGQVLPPALPAVRGEVGRPTAEARNQERGPVSALWQLLPGERVWEVASYYDDGDNPIAREGWSSYERSERAAEAFAHAALCESRCEGPGGFWYAAIRRGRVVDPIGDGHPHDRSFEPDPDWSRTLLADD